MADITALPDCARYSLRGDAAMLVAGCAAFGVPTPETLRSTRAGDRAALWLSPDEALLLGPAGTPPPAEGLVVDISHRQIAFELSGPDALASLSAGCPLDLEQLDVDSCTRTLFHKAEIILWRTGPSAWRLEVWRSFAAYVRALLGQAAKDWAA